MPFLLNLAGCRFSDPRTLLCTLRFRPLHSQVRQVSLPFSPYIFCRPPAYRSQPPPLETFRLRCITAAITVTLCRLHRASDRISAACRSIRVGISGRYPVILPIQIISSIKHSPAAPFNPQNIVLMCFTPNLFS